MADRTRIVCLHEGVAGRSIDPVFIRTLLKALDPAWVRPWLGSNVVRTVPCNGRSELLDGFPNQLRSCLGVGSDTTLMVWADLDDDMVDGEALKAEFWKVAKANSISKYDFERVVFVFAKDRLENWIEYLNTGRTDEDQSGPRLKNPKEAAAAAKRLAEICRMNVKVPLPPSLTWSCANWRRLVDSIK